jgi:hypothetical protein
MQHYQDTVAAYANEPNVPLRDPNPMMDRAARDLVAPLPTPHAPLRGMAQYAVMLDDPMKLKLDRDALKQLYYEQSTARTAWQRLLDGDDDEDPDSSV